MTMAFLIFACLIMISVINWLLKIKIVNGIHRITDDLSKITEGRLDTVVNVDNNPEFRLLSQGINKMVQGILNATVRVSQVIDVVDMPIGVFEYGKDSREVMATDRLRLVLGWTEEEGKNCIRIRRTSKNVSGKFCAGRQQGKRMCIRFGEA